LCNICTMPTKIFVGRLAEGVSSDDIRALFRKFGAVTECDILSNFGFVVSNYLCYNRYFCILFYCAVF